MRWRSRSKGIAETPQFDRSLPYNRGMKHLDILVPFGLPPAELARDLARQAKTPALAIMLSRHSKTFSLRNQDPFSRALPHEHWLSRQFGLPRTAAAEGAGEHDTSPAAAAALMRHHGLAPESGFWFVLHPAHIHVARDHLVLTDIAQLELEENESRRLFDSAHALFEEIGRPLLYGDATTWFMRADDWAGLRTSSPDAASGRNIDIWMPQGPGELAWRKLQNEVQMQWFSENQGEAREMRGLKAINSLWLWGGADAADAAPAHPEWQQVFNLPGWSRALASSRLLPADGIATVLAPPAQGGLLVLDSLIAPGLTDEWGYWLERLETLDREWLTPLLQALRSKKLDSLTLTLTGSDRLAQYTVTRAALRKFWVKPSLNRLAA